MSAREKLIMDSMGEVGPFQVKIFLLISLLKFPTAWTLLGMIFMGAPVPFTCSDSTEQCIDSQGKECNRWTYNRTVFKETITTEWDLVCGRKHLTNLAQTTYMIGILFGTIFFSMASDKYGRKKPLILTGVLQLITGVASSVVPWYWGFVALRFVQALCVGGNMTIAFVICMEALSGSWRTIMATLTHIPFNFGSIIMSVIAYFTREWRLFQFIISLPIGIIVFYWWLIPESPRWLIAVGKDKEALALLQEIAKTNNRPIPEKIPEKAANHDPTAENKATIIDLFRTPNMRLKTIVVWLNWTNIGLCFFGLEQYLSHSGGDIFINVAASSAFMIPGVLASIYTMDKFGRKLTLFGGQILAALSCFVILVLPESLAHLDWYRVCFATLGVTGTAVGFTTLYLYSSELFPTVVRNTGLGSGSMCARIGSMIAPFVASLALVSPSIPAAFFGVSSLTSALLCLLLPETVRTVLPVSLEDGENFGKKTKDANTNGNLNRAYDEEIRMET